jgi:hypothetical protein
MLSLFALLSSLVPGAPVFPASLWSAAPPEPTKGVVSKGVAYACCWDTKRRHLARLWFAPLDGSRPPRSQVLAVSHFSPPRWHVRRGQVWAAEASSLLYGRSWQQTRHTALRYELGPFKRGRRLAAPGAEEGPFGLGAFANADPLEEAIWLGVGSEFVPDLHYDYLPEGVDRVLLFRLTNVRGTVAPEVNGERQITQTRDEETRPVWSLRVFSIEGRYDRAKGDWVQTPWAVEADIAVKFTEPFFALGKGEDYYFVTASGKVFVARKPARGKRRSMEAVWSDPRRPVRLFLTDADAGRTFLFVGRGGARRPAFFELAPKPKLEEYDPAAVPLPRSAGPDRALLHLARILVALKKVKVE